MLESLQCHVRQLKDGATIQTLSPIAEEQIRQLLHLSEAARNNIAQQHILRYLGFPGMRERGDTVEEAYSETFRWIFQDDDVRNDAAPLPEHESIDANLFGPNPTEDWVEFENRMISDIAERINAQRREDMDMQEVDTSHINAIEGKPRDAICEDFEMRDNRSRPQHDVADQSGSLFTRWLSSGQGVFHVSGKLSSGKSTLMKFLSQHPRTKEELQRWAGTYDMFASLKCTVVRIRVD